MIVNCIVTGEHTISHRQKCGPRDSEYILPVFDLSAAGRLLNVRLVMTDDVAESRMRELGAEAAVNYRLRTMSIGGLIN